VGLAAAAGAQLLGAAVVIVGDMIPERLAQAKSFGCETVDLRKDATLGDQIAQILGEPLVDSAVDCVASKPTATARTRARNSRPPYSIPFRNWSAPVAPSASRPVRDRRSRAVDEAAKIGALSIRIGLGWAKSCSFHTGQCPVLRYNRQLMQAILHDKVHPAKATNVQMISLDEAPQGYKDFDKGAARSS